MNWTDCSLTESIPGKSGGVALIIGTRVPADVLVSNFLAGSPVEEVADNFEVSVTVVEEVLRYALDHSVPRAA